MSRPAQMRFSFNLFYAKIVTRQNSIHSNYIKRNGERKRRRKRKNKTIYQIISFHRNHQTFSQFVSGWGAEKILINLISKVQNGFDENV